MALSDKQRAEMKMRREKILTVATHNFSFLGYDNVPLSKIAKEAGVSYGNIFTYFETKDHLFSTVIIETLQELEQEILNFSDQPKDPLQEVKDMAKKHIQIYSRREVYLRLVQQVIGQHTRFPDLFHQLDVFHMAFKAKLVKLILAGQQEGQMAILPPETTAVTYTSFLLGLRLNLTDPPEASIWESFVKNAVQIFGPVSPSY